MSLTKKQESSISRRSGVVVVLASLVLHSVCTAGQNPKDYDDMIIGLTNATPEGLQTMVQEQYEQYFNAEITEMNSVADALDERAYAVSDAIPPFCLYQHDTGGL